ncbi:DHA2 family efflux MFS transporter permease subunit [Seongchinamella unica]|uniref:DHA2 family efflux MFS transporter permease subunit n=2 Tax=Seongchinamella unica TaxID=2547392 RepID=A0A4R5LN91_9GAMM|nr:DHA2 family efflux MFS transporter permease subunit [Seongchinamella unica]
MLATIMQVVDTTIANVALPHMRGSLGAGVEQVTWILTSYIVATAIMTLPVGYLAQRFGRRNVFLWSIIGFTISSMLCGQANSLTEMVVWRLLQGLFGASLVPLSQATLLDVFPREKLASAMGIWSMGVMVGPVLGPTLGGWLTDTYSWRWVFYINVPLGVLSTIGIFISMPDSKPGTRRFDLRGFAFLALAVATLQLLLDRGEQVDWFQSLEVQLYAVLSVLGLYLYLVHSATSNNRFLSPDLFRDRNLVAAVVFIFVTGIVMLATMALLPPFLQQWKGYPAASAGLVMMPRGIGTMISSLLVARFLRYFDARAVILAGLALVTVSLKSMAGFNMEVGQRDIVITGLLQGFGLGLVIVPTSTLAFATLSPALRDEASGLYSLARNLGSSIGVSIVMAVLSRSLWINQQELGARVQMSPELAEALRSGTDGALAVPASVMNEVNRQAAEVAYVNDFHMLMLINLLAMPLVLMLANPDRAAAGVLSRFSISRIRQFVSMSQR